MEKTTIIVIKNFKGNEVKLDLSKTYECISCSYATDDKPHIYTGYYLYRELNEYTTDSIIYNTRVKDLKEV